MTKVSDQPTRTKDVLGDWVCGSCEHIYSVTVPVRICNMIYKPMTISQASTHIFPRANIIGYTAYLLVAQSTYIYNVYMYIHVYCVGVYVNM